MLRSPTHRHFTHMSSAFSLGSFQLPFKSDSGGLILAPAGEMNALSASFLSAYIICSNDIPSSLHSVSRS